MMYGIIKWSVSKKPLRGSYIFFQSTKLDKMAFTRIVVFTILVSLARAGKNNLIFIFNT